MSQESWDSDTVFTEMYHNAMMVILNGDVYEDSFPIVDIMEKIKSMQLKGYDCCVYYTEGGEWPHEVMYMVLAMIKGNIQYGNMVALHILGKTGKKHAVGVGVFPQVSATIIRFNTSVML